MKLLKLYIENFGCLSGYSLDFSEGLTVLQEENGFGKTTLAEFIRVMFYGMPRKTKFLAKNIREKYQPWQGGTYGGWLIFSHNGETYKAERTFGQNPRQDTFRLYDQRTSRPSAAFSEHLGEELFQLDSDSYERSTYLPQMAEPGPLTTDSIRAKLSDLVEDSGDVGNYENAIAALRAKRSSLIPYRGDGGAVARQQSEILKLQREIADLAPLKDQVAEEKESLLQQQEQKKALEAEREVCRRSLTLSAEARARQTVRDQEKAREETLADLHGQLSCLQAPYPQGLPGEKDLQALQTLFLSCRELQQEQESPDLTFPYGKNPPSREDMNHYEEVSHRLIYLKTARQQLQLPEEAELASLQAFFAPGIPEDPALLRQKARELLSLRPETDFSEEDQQQLTRLQQDFGENPPKGEQLEALLKADTRLQILRQQMEEAPEPAPRKKGLSPLIPGIFGVLLFLVSIVLFIVRQPIFGGISLGIGALLLIFSLYLLLRQELRREISGVRPGQSGLQQEADALQQEISDFLSAYPTQGHTSSDRLLNLQQKLRQYQSLRERYSQFLQEQSRVEEKKQELTAFLHQALSPYFKDDSHYEAQAEMLQNQLLRYQALCRRREELEEKRSLLEPEISGLQEQLQGYLFSYGLGMDAEDPGAELLKLHQAAASWHAAMDLAEEQFLRQEQKRRDLKKNQEEAQKILNPFGLSLKFGDMDGLQALREARMAIRNLEEQIHREEASLHAFRQEQKTLLTGETDPTLPSPEVLKSREQALSSQVSQAETHIAGISQQLRLLEQKAETLPELQDRLARLQETLDQDRESARILDETINYLGKAKENLTFRYLDRVVAHFRDYAEHLLGMDPDLMTVDPDLNVQVQCRGLSRNLAHFSAGQTDLIMLCMRLSLVDALFEGSRPLLILDDPFVNLDDRHMEKALSLLQHLSRDHQILYLCCHSSRAGQNPDRQCR